MDLYFVAKLCKFKKIVVVPLKYIFKLDLAKSLNYRINRNQKHILFWSTDLSKEPNFTLPLDARFDENDACFYARFLKVFSKYTCFLHYN